MVPAATTRVVVHEDEYIFIAFDGPSRVTYDVQVLEGPNVDVFLMDEVHHLPIPNHPSIRDLCSYFRILPSSSSSLGLQENFRLYAADSWANSAWRVIDEGSKQGTRRASARLRVGPGRWFLVVDNRADDYDVLPSGPSSSGPALLQLEFNTSSATIRVPPSKPQAEATTDNNGKKVVSSNNINVVVRSAPVLRWSLLLFFAALPGWPLWRHYSIMVEYAGGSGPAGGLWAWLPFFACAGAAVRSLSLTKATSTGD